MTQYSENFSGMTTGANPTNFTDRYAAESFVSVENPAIGENEDRCLKFGSADTGIVFQSFDDVDGDGSRADSDLLIRYRQSTDDDNHMRPTLRASGSSGNETCYYMAINSSGFLTINELQAGTFGQLALGIDVDKTGPWWRAFGDAAFAFQPVNVWLWMRFRANGTGATVTLEASIWADGWPEPSSPTLSVNDTSGNRITANGWTGPAVNSITGDTFIDEVSVGTAGDVADTVIDTTTVIRDTTIQAQILEQNTAGTARVSTVQADVLYLQPAPDVGIGGQLIITT